MFFEKIKEILFETTAFYKLEEKETSYKDLIIYYLGILGLMLPIGLIVNLLTSDYGFWISLGSLALLLVIGTIVFIITLFINQFFVNLFGGQHGFFRTAQSYVYGATPFMLLAFIPWANILGWAYSVYTTITGLIQLQKMNLGKAVLAYIIPAVIYLLAMLGFISVFLVPYL